MLTALVDNGQRRVVEPLGQRPGAHHAADIGGDDHDVLVAMAPDDIFADHRCAIEIVGRDIEKALDLAGMEVHGQDAVGARLGDQVGHQFGRDRRARSGLAVLPGIAEIGDDGGNALGRGPAQRVDADQQFHQIVIGRMAG